MSDQTQLTIDFDTFKFDVRRDTLDFRDQMYVPTLVEVPTSIDLIEYQKVGVPVRNQGNEGACTGFGLATVANYLLRRRKVTSDEVEVSPRMFYEMAKRYDEYPGEQYSGSSARGAMKGWHKSGVCADTLWPYHSGDIDRALTRERTNDARNRPLGAYFRVNHKDLVAMHAALAEVGILYATANVHNGWKPPVPKGIIPYEPSSSEYGIAGVHAFAIVAYDREGFWIQNSWGKTWGREGLGRISYDDWLANGLDVWVARLGVPVIRLSEAAAAASNAPGAMASASYSYADLRPHVVSLGNDGQLSDRGVYGTSKQEIESIFADDIPHLTNGWDKRRILLYAHGGLVGEAGFLQRLAEYRSAFMQVQVYPLAFVWHTDLWSTITDILHDATRQRRPEGLLDDTLDFMLDRLDETLEVIVRGLRIRGLWDEMKENALLATTSKDGGGRFVLDQLAQLIDRYPGEVEVHVIGHSAGSIFHAPLVQYFTARGSVPKMEAAMGRDRKIASCTLWAPAITTKKFKETYLPAIQAQNIERFSLFTLTNEAEENDNCSNIYHKSLLYMVSNALEDSAHEPLLGLEKSVNGDPELKGLFDNRRADWVEAPNMGVHANGSSAAHHGDFDDDPTTLMATLARILPAGKVPSNNIFDFKRSSASMSDRRQSLQ